MTPLGGTTRTAASPVVRVGRRLLDNGLTVLVQPDPGLGFVVVDVWHRVGAGADPLRGSGLAHLVEHATVGGAAAGLDGPPSSAATTSLERTNYLDSGPPGSLPDLLRRAAQRIRGVSVGVDDAVLDVHRHAILNEIREREQPARFGSGPRRSLALLFGPHHPWGRPALGIPEHLAGLGPGDIANFTGRHGSATELVVSIVGAVDVPLALELAQRSFADLPTGPRRPVDLPPVSWRAGREDVEEGQAIGLLRFTWRLPAAGCRFDAAGEVILRLLAGGPWSVLHSGVTARGLALGAAAAHTPCSAGTSIGVVKLTVPAEGDLDDVESVVTELVQHLACSGPHEDALEAARATQAKRWLGVLSSARSRAEQLCQHEAWQGDAEELNDRLPSLRGVTADDVAEVARTWLREPAVVAFHAAGAVPGRWIL